MKTFFCLILSLFILESKAQAVDIQTEINQQVWLPFMETFSNNNTIGFMNLHSKDLIRVPIDSKKILYYDEYLKGNEEGNKWSIEKRRKKAIEFSFVQRLHRDETAFEIGYYKVTYTGPDGKTSFGYGKFTVVLRKIAGVWKITLDSDSSEGINESVFLTGKKLADK